MRMCVFYYRQCVYNPQGIISVNRNMRNSKSSCGEIINSERGKTSLVKDFIQENTNYPNQILRFANASNPIHGTQKPVALFEYLIKTYTNEGDLVLDNCAGSGTTGVACQNLKRNYILIEKEPKYYEIILKRFAEYQLTL